MPGPLDAPLYPHPLVVESLAVITHPTGILDLSHTHILDPLGRAILIPGPVLPVPYAH